MLWAVLRLITTVVATAAVAVPTAIAREPDTTHFGVKAILAQINEVRAEHELQPLRLAHPLRVAARAHSSEMGTVGYFGHDSADGTSFWKRVESYYAADGYRYWS